MSHVQDGHLEALWICGQCFHIPSHQLYLLAIVDIVISVIAHSAFLLVATLFPKMHFQVEVIARLFISFRRVFVDTSFHACDDRDVLSQSRCFASHGIITFKTHTLR